MTTRISRPMIKPGGLILASEVGYGTSTVEDFLDGFIGQSITINVPADQSTIQGAMNYLRGFTISRGAQVTIQVADGNYPLSGTVNLNHPQGSLIRLIGNQTTPANCVLTVADAATFDALVCSAGNTFGFLDGFTITRPTKSEMPINTTAVLATQGATLICGSNMRISKWFYGIAARDGSYVYCPAAQVDQAGDVGIWAFCGSTIVCNGSTSTNADAAGNPWGFGFQAEFGSCLVGTGISASGCKIAGVASLSGSICRIQDSTSNGNVGSGFFTSGIGVIECNGTTVANSNTRYGMEIIDGQGRITGISTNTGNTLGSMNPIPFSNISSGQARFASSSGPLRIDTPDSSSVFFNTAGGLQAEVRHAATSVNRLYLQGAAAGSPVVLGAAGSDTNVDVLITPRGSGNVRFGSLTASADAPVTGYITIKDASGTVRKLAVIA